MSEDNQENGTANGDVPEIELIIKGEIKTVDATETDKKPNEETLIPVAPVQSTLPTASTSDQFIIFELKTDTEPMYNYVIKQVKKPPPEVENTGQTVASANSEGNRVEEIPFVISVQVPSCEENKEETKENSPKTQRALNRKRLAEALEAVVSRELTISKAASVYQVTKSTLWKEVNKRTDHRRKIVDEELNRTIAKRICSGESLSKISRTLKVAKSTLHQHKVRLAQSGQLPANVTLKPPVDPAERLAVKERVIEAFRGCRVNGMSIRLAAKFFSIPPTTLWRHIQQYKALHQGAANSAQTVQNFPEGGEEETETENGSTNEESSGEDETSAQESDASTICSEGQETATSEVDDFLISFDFDTFEQYVKKELES